MPHPRLFANTPTHETPTSAADDKADAEDARREKTMSSGEHAPDVMTIWTLNGTGLSRQRPSQAGTQPSLRTRQAVKKKRIFRRRCDTPHRYRRDDGVHRCIHCCRATPPCAEWPLSIHSGMHLFSAKPLDEVANRKQAIALWQPQDEHTPPAIGGRGAFIIRSTTEPHEQHQNPRIPMA